MLKYQFLQVLFFFLKEDDIIFNSKDLIGFDESDKLIIFETNFIKSFTKNIEKIIDKEDEINKILSMSGLGKNKFTHKEINNFDTFLFFML